MNIFSIISFTTVLLLAAVSKAAPVDPGIAPRCAASFHLLSLSGYADKAIEVWLKDHKLYEEDIETRHYFYGDIDGDGKNDLLLVTCLSKADSNIWSIDFVLIRASAPSNPTIIKFGGEDERSYKNIYMDCHGIHVNALYYGRSDPDCCPSIEKKVDFVWKGNALAEQKVP